MSPGARRRGFTLFELLVVLGALSVLAGIGYLTMQPAGRAGSAARATDALGDALRVARTQAILRGTETRLLVHFDASDPERFLRFVGLVASDGAGGWEAIERGIYLPKGCYVVPQAVDGVAFVDWEGVRSRYDAAAGAGANDAVVAFDAALFDPSLPSVEGGSEINWIAWQFKPNGTLDTVEASGVAPTPNYFVVGEGDWSGDTLRFSKRSGALGIGVKPTGKLFRIYDVLSYESL